VKQKLNFYEPFFPYWMKMLRASMKQQIKDDLKPREKKRLT